MICSDKTGTLTENQMTVTVLDVAGKRMDLPLTERRKRTGGPTAVQAAAEASSPEGPSLAILLAGAGLCNDAELEFDSHEGSYRAIGDPTEAALMVAAAEMGLPKDELTAAWPRTDELPFDSDRKRMTTVHRRVATDDDRPVASVVKLLIDELNDADQLAFTKGAVDQVLEASEFGWVDQQPEKPKRVR